MYCLDAMEKTFYERCLLQKNCRVYEKCELPDAITHSTNSCSTATVKSSFPVMNKVSNIGIFALFEF